MRKEVKLGMAIGGGLIAVLVVYLLVAPPANNKSGAQLTGGGGAGSIIDGSQPGDASAAATGAGATDDKTATAAANRNGAAEGAGQAAAASPANTVVDGQSSASHEGAKERVAARSGDNGAGSGDKWSAALNKGKIDKPTDATPATAAPAAKERVAIKPTPIKHESIAQANVAPVASEPKLYFNPNDAWGGGVSTDAVFGTRTTHAAAGKTAARGASSTAGTPSAAAAPAAAVATAGTHVVQSGDTLSSIAMDAYGSAAYYPHLLRANPTVNPNNLKLGTVLTLPKADEVKVIASAGEHSAGERGTAALAVVQDVKIDPKTQYQVQSGDSLYKISLKIYGKPTFVDRIYEKNKALIGSDPKKLKLGMILELPDKSAAAVASPRQETTSQASTEADRR